MCFTECKDFYEVSVTVDQLECHGTCTEEQFNLFNYWNGNSKHRNVVQDLLTEKASIFSDTFQTENEEWFIDEDNSVGIQKLLYTDTMPDAIKKYTFVISQSELFSGPNSPTGALLVNSTTQFYNTLNNENLEHQAFLRKTPSTPENPSIEDEFECLFLQGNPGDTNSDECIEEQKVDNTKNCQYWQTCDFTAVKGAECSVVVSRVIALVIPIVIVLLATAIFTIFHFKRKADKAKDVIGIITDRLPVFGGSSRSNGEGTSTMPQGTANLRNSIYNATPGIDKAIQQNPTIVLGSVYKGKDSQKKQNKGLDEDDRSDDETYNNTQASMTYNNSSFGYNNSTRTGYNNTQSSLKYTNDNEDIETGRDGRGRPGSYLAHN